MEVNTKIEYDLKTAIDKYYDAKPDWGSKDRDYFYMSEAGKCERSIFYGFKNKETKSVDARVRRILENGDYVHARFMKIFAEMGILVAAEITPQQTELIHGRADAIITDGKQNYIVDVKSISHWSFTPLKEAKEEHKIQLMMYMYFFKIPRGYLLYECKNTQAIKSFYIELDTKLIEDKLDSLRKLKENINSNTVPDCIGTIEKCKYCDYKLLCDKVVS